MLRNLQIAVALVGFAAFAAAGTPGDSLRFAGRPRATTEGKCWPGQPPRIRPDDTFTQDGCYEVSGASVMRRGSDGQAIWSKTLDGDIGGVRPPHILHDTERVYLSHDAGVTALSAETGLIVWHSPGLNDRMLLTGELLLAAGRSAAPGNSGSFVTARRTVDGREVFRLKWDASRLDPMPLWEFGGLFVVQDGDLPTPAAVAVVFDSRGQVLWRSNEFIIDGLRIGSDVVLLMDGEVARLGRSGARRWSFPSLDSGNGDGGGGGLVPVPGGDLIEFEYEVQDDSGVGVRRFDPVHGIPRWSTHCKPLGVAYKRYLQEARATLEAGQLKIICHGVYGTFTEWLDLATGKQVRRTQD